MVGNYRRLQTDTEQCKKCRGYVLKGEKCGLCVDTCHSCGTTETYAPHIIDRQKTCASCVQSKKYVCCNVCGDYTFNPTLCARHSPAPCKPEEKETMKISPNAIKILL